MASEMSKRRVFEILGILNILRQNMKRNANGFSICRNGKEHLSYYMMRKKAEIATPFKNGPRFIH